jgi:hypothetical protein
MGKKVIRPLGRKNTKNRKTVYKKDKKSDSDKDSDKEKEKDSDSDSSSGFKK